MSKSITIEVSDSELRGALLRLQQRSGNLSPVLKALGEDIQERVKRRFASATDPAGGKWQPNTRSTIEAYVAAKSDKSKSGKIGAKGITAAMSKRPLQGHSGDLARQISYMASNSSLVLSASPVYAAIQQFGGIAGRSVRIPARPFMPVTLSGDLYPAEKSQVLKEIANFLEVAF